jgi:hypothetical protein
VQQQVPGFLVAGVFGVFVVGVRRMSVWRWVAAPVGVAGLYDCYADPE